MVAPHDTGKLVRSLVRVPGSGRNRKMAAAFCDLSRVSPLAASVQVPSTLPPALARRIVQLQQPETNTEEMNEEENRGKCKQLSGTGRKRAYPQENSSAQNTNYVAPDGACGEDNPSPPPPKRSCRATLAPVQVGIVQQTTLPASGSVVLVPMVMQPQQLVALRLQQPVPLQSSPQHGILQQQTTILPAAVARQSSPQHGILQQQTTILPAAVAGRISVSQLLQEVEVLRGENVTLQQRLSLFQQLFRDKKRLTSVLQRLGVNVQQ